MPERTKALAQDVLRRLFDDGIVRADAYGLWTERNVYVFLAAMLILGEYFDTDVENRWAADTLTDDVASEDVKAMMLQTRISELTGEELLT